MSKNNKQQIKPDLLLLHTSEEFAFKSITSKSKQAIILKGTIPEQENEVVIKRFNMNESNKAFIRELKILSKIQQNPFVKIRNLPQIISFKYDSSFGEILMSDAGLDLSNILSLFARQEEDSLENFLQQSALKIGYQVLEALEILHQAGFVHCDLKIDNICGKFNQETKEYEYQLIDFGLVQKFKKGSEFLPQKQLDHFRGNILFASQNAIELKTQSIKDDLESLFNIIYFLSNNMSLPWIEGLDMSGVIPDIFKLVLKRRVKNRKLYQQQISASLPSRLQTTYTYIMNLGFDEIPDYSRIKEAFKNTDDIASVCLNPHNTQYFEYSFALNYQVGEPVNDIKKQSINQLQLSRIVSMADIEQDIEEINKQEQLIGSQEFKDQIFAIEVKNEGSDPLLAERKHYQKESQQQRIIEYKFLDYSKTAKNLYSDKKRSPLVEGYSMNYKREQSTVQLSSNQMFDSEKLIANEIKGINSNEKQQMNDDQDLEFSDDMNETDYSTDSKLSGSSIPFCDFAIEIHSNDLKNIKCL